MPRAPSEDAQRRKADVMRMRRQGMEFAEIGEHLGVSKQRAHQIYVAALKEIPAQDVAEYRAEQAERLDELLRKAHQVLANKHITVNNGKVIYLDGQPVEDDAPTLMAIKTILQIEERRARLLGLDTPVRQEIGGSLTVTYNFEGINMGDLK